MSTIINIFKRQEKKREDKSLDIVNLLAEGMRQFSVAEAYLWPPVSPALERAGIDHCWGKDSGQNGLCSDSEWELICSVSHFSSFSTKALGGKKVKPVGTELSLLLASGLGLQKAFHLISQKFVLPGNRVWHHLMLKFLRIMLLQHNFQAELWQNTVLCPDFEFLKFFLRPDWKCRSLSGWKAVKSPWQASKTGYSWPSQKVM